MVRMLWESGPLFSPSLAPGEPWMQKKGNQFEIGSKPERATGRTSCGLVWAARVRMQSPGLKRGDRYPSRRFLCMPGPTLDTRVTCPRKAIIGWNCWEGCHRQSWSCPTTSKQLKISPQWHRFMTTKPKSHMFTDGMVWAQLSSWVTGPLSSGVACEMGVNILSHIHL